MSKALTAAVIEKIIFERIYNSVTYWGKETLHLKKGIIEHKCKHERFQYCSFGLIPCWYLKNGERQALNLKQASKEHRHTNKN